ncbi:hypothetical protein AUCHE_08_04670 [Austwickia chelonae NBRC 105200]|uniref:Uncharacterized protein n=1 Tax=Austwickia chelonae NBRC 105200 TaxID=1184607 RepID=K6UML6_9MICO|nr:hypothetical protein AUCHE_08_04670 [Austwickia chelonae NBRC 105200]
MRHGGSGYRASGAQRKAAAAAKRLKNAKLVANLRLHAYVEERLAGRITRVDEIRIEGPEPPRFTGRNNPPRKDRAWLWAWSKGPPRPKTAPSPDAGKATY